MSDFNFFAELKQKIQTQIREQETLLSDTEFHFETPPEEKFGDISLTCFPFARIFRKSPHYIAESIASSFQAQKIFSKVEAVSGYVNFFIQSTYLAEILFPQILQQEEYGFHSVGKGKRILIEFSGPNTNKPLHLGHGRNNMIGYALANIFECCGYKVFRVNIVNDRGIHICQSLVSYLLYGEGKTPKSVNKKGDHFIGDFYVLFHKKKNPQIEKKAYTMLTEWENDNKKIKELWQKTRNWVLEGFQETYKRMDIHFDKYYFESEVYRAGKEKILKALYDGIFQQKEDGSIYIDLSAENLGEKILLRKDGSSIYITQDIEATIQKFTDFSIDKAIWVVGNEQDHHFQVLFKIIEKLGYQWAKNCEHISYAMMTLPEGKMKSREGKVVELDELMDELKNGAFEELKHRQEKDSVPRQEKELLQTAEYIGQAALKFFILKTHIQKKIAFEPQKSLNFEGKTGPYLQYTYARIFSLLAKEDLQVTYSHIFEQIHWEREERNILIHLVRLPQVTLDAYQNRNPASIANYTYELCRFFNKFYYSYPILKNTDQVIRQFRILLTIAVQKVLQKCFSIMGIYPLNRM